jgi:ActR/RegA family two-component response regulator
MKILIVDGDETQLSVLAGGLETRGLEVVPTHFGDGALSLFKKDGPWTFVLSDYRFIPCREIKGWSGVGDRDPHD